MRTIKMILTLALGLTTTHASATLLPFVDEVVAAPLMGDDSTSFVEGYVQLNKTNSTISLVLEPGENSCDGPCPEATPASYDYFLEGVKSRVDECNAVIYEAEQTGDHTIRVQLIDNTQYNYDNCPTFLPVPETVVQVEQIVYGPSSTEERAGFLAAPALAPIRY